MLSRRGQRYLGHVRRDLMTGKQVAVKVFKRPVDPEVAYQLVQGINIQCGA